MTVAEQIFRWSHPVQFWADYDSQEPCLCQTCTRMGEIVAAAIAEEQEAHRLTVKMAAELLDEVRAQWGQDYLWKKGGMDGKVAAPKTRMP